jgi:hypothetical protein
MRQYVETDLEADREVANTLAELIIGGSLASSVMATNRTARAGLTMTTRETRTLLRERQVYKSVYKRHARGRTLVRIRPLTLVAGVGFEPTTSGL